MATSSLSLRGTTFVAGLSAIVEYRTTSGIRPNILEMSYIQLTNVNTQIGIGRPGAIGLTPSNTVFQMDDPSQPASVLQGALSWGTSPTVPANYHRKWNGTLASVGVIFSFPRGLAIPILTSVVVWNIAAAAACDINCVADE